MDKENYLRFLVMLSLSFVIMYSVMYLNASNSTHIFLNLNRVYMTLLMISPMAIVMLWIMSGMFKKKKLNALIYTVSIAVFFIALTLLRNQTFVDDKQFMRSMIPHHSTAILVSEQANITDPEVQELAKQIYETQLEEIAQMERILTRMNGY